MGSQVGFVCKGSSTFSAGEGFFSSMGPEMTLQQPWSRERLSTIRAFARESVRSDVHLESRIAVVLFITILAGGLLLDLV